MSSNNYSSDAKSRALEGGYQTNFKDNLAVYDSMPPEIRRLARAAALPVNLNNFVKYIQLGYEISFICEEFKKAPVYTGFPSKGTSTLFSTEKST